MTELYLGENSRFLSRRGTSVNSTSQKHELSLPPKTGLPLFEMVCVANGFQKRGLIEEERVQATIQAIVAIQSRYLGTRPVGNEDLKKVFDYYRLQKTQKLQ